MPRVLGQYWDFSKAILAKSQECQRPWEFQAHLFCLKGHSRNECMEMTLQNSNFYVLDVVIIPNGWLETRNSLYKQVGHHHVDFRLSLAHHTAEKGDLSIVKSLNNVCDVGMRLVDEDRMTLVEHATVVVHVEKKVNVHCRIAAPN